VSELDGTGWSSRLSLHMGERRRINRLVIRRIPV
jgi:hypothetical protein